SAGDEQSHSAILRRRAARPVRESRFAVTILSANRNGTPDSSARGTAKNVRASAVPHSRRPFPGPSRRTPTKVDPYFRCDRDTFPRDLPSSPPFDVTTINQPFGGPA